MFIHVETRQRPQFYWATLMLVFLCVICFAAVILLPTQERLAVLLQWGTVPSSVFVAQETFWMQLRNPELLHLFTALFFHAGWLHLLSNMLFLIIFGFPAERSLSSLRFLFLFIIGGVIANLIGALSVADLHEPIIGCSGAVSAVLGTYVTLFPRARLGLVLPLGLFLEFVRVPAYLLIGIWMLLQLLFSYVGASYGAVVWWTHIAGFLFGVVFALFSRKPIARRLRRGR